jgi:CYTH domain-containing protein
MAIEIERKFLTKSNEWKNLANGIRYCQGYLPVSGECIVRIRIAGNEGFITIKGRAIGASRIEYEYEIPAVEAEAILKDFCEKPLIEKLRYKVHYAGMTWEIDEFYGDNAGLITAEIELSSENQSFELPPWIDKEVTGDHRYSNSNLVKNPYKNWNLS